MDGKNIRIKVSSNRGLRLQGQRRIFQLKRRDPLTGLYLEKAFKSKVKEKLEDWQENMEYAFVYTDIYDFSYINDNFGHFAGNEI